MVLNDMLCQVHNSKLDVSYKWMDLIYENVDFPVLNIFIVEGYIQVCFGMTNVCLSCPIYLSISFSYFQ